MDLKLEIPALENGVAKKETITTLNTDIFPLMPAQYNFFDGLTVMISACHVTKRGRPGFDSPSERLPPLWAHAQIYFLRFFSMRFVTWQAEIMTVRPSKKLYWAGIESNCGSYIAICVCLSSWTHAGKPMIRSSCLETIFFVSNSILLSDQMCHLESPWRNNAKYPKTRKNSI